MTNDIYEQYITLQFKAEKQKLRQEQKQERATALMSMWEGL